MPSNKKILIVESDEAAAETVAKMLRESLFETVILQPHEVLALLFIELEPDIVIIYRKLFLKNRQLFVEGNKRLSGARLIITSGAYLNEDRISELHIDGFLQKPFTPEDLAKVLSF